MSLQRRLVAMPHADPPDVVRALVVAGDYRIPYLAAGRGPVVVLLSASPSVRSVFLRELPRTMRLLIPDLHDVGVDRGNPQGGAPGVPGEAETGARWVEGFLDALGVFGAWLAFDSSARAVVDAFESLSPERLNGRLPVDEALSHDELLRGLVQHVSTTVMLEAGAAPSIDLRVPRPKVRE